jgi:phosphoserine phosphatase
MAGQENHFASARLSRRTLLHGAAAASLAVLAPGSARAATPSPADALLSWNDGQIKETILDFVRRTTSVESQEWVAPADRIAAFDLDGTLWVERPTYVDLLFVEERARQQLELDPSLADREPWKGVINLDDDARYQLTDEEVTGLVFDTYVGFTPEEYRELATIWLNSAMNVVLGRRHVDCTYQPMLELLAFLRAHEFTVVMASAGDIEFLRAHCEPVFGIDRNLAVGTSVVTTLRTEGDLTELVRMDQGGQGVWGDGKPIAINLHIGRRPILAVGNADSDLQMLGYALSSDHPSLAMIVHHDDAEREFVYDKTVNLKTPLDRLAALGIDVISMKNDFAVMFPPLPGPDLLAG